MIFFLGLKVVARDDTEGWDCDKHITCNVLFFLLTRFSRVACFRAWAVSTINTHGMQLLSVATQPATSTTSATSARQNTTGPFQFPRALKISDPSLFVSRSEPELKPARIPASQKLRRQYFKTA